MHQQVVGSQNMNQASLSYEVLKKLTQFIISLSVFSLIFMHPSWLYLVHSFMPNHITFSSQLFSCATDKNYLFLLCNGIVVFIAKYSTQKIEPQPPPPPEISSENDIIFKEYTQESLQLPVEKLVTVEYVDIEEDEVEEKSSELNVAMMEEKTEEEDDDVIFDDNKEEDFEEEYESEDCVEEEEEEEDEEIDMLSTEELNRRFEDFIRKMKEDLRIEAQQQLIMV